MDRLRRRHHRAHHLAIRLGILLGVTLALAACSKAWVRWEDKQVSYTVKPGDTLYQIAFKHQLDYREIRWWNGLGRDDKIYPGQVLRLDPPLPGELRPPPKVPAYSPPATTTSRRGSGATPAPRRPPAATPRPGRTAVAPGPRRWQWPVQGPLLASFDPSKGRKGIDIGGAVGDSIGAAAAGKVVYAGGALKGYGLLVIIKHGDEFLTAYGHNQRLLVGEGEQVKAGQAIATMGLGPQNRPLLHFEIRKAGQPIDPGGLLPVAD